MQRLQYAGLDFDTSNDSLLARMQTQFAGEFNDFAVSSLAIVLLDLESYGADALSFYLDRRAAEVYLETARTRGATARITRQLGYKMRGASAAAVDLRVAVADTLPIAVSIPAGFAMRGPNGLVYETARAVTFLANETGGAATKIVPVFEGQQFSESFVSDGTPNQVFAIRRASAGKYVVSGTVTVLVNGTTWSEVDMLTFGDDPVYECGYNDAPPTLRFGDGITGSIPAAGATVQVGYRASSGVAGRVTQGSITQPVTPLVVNFTTITLTITSPEGSSGGDDPESLEEARANAPLAWKSRQVAVTRGDYVGLSTAFADPVAGRVAVAQAFVSRSATTDLALQDQLRAVRTAALAPVAPTAGALASIRYRIGSLRTELTNLLESLTETAARTQTAQTNLTAILASARQITAAVGNLAATSTTITSAVAVARSLLGGFTVVSSMTTEQIRQTTLDTLTSRLDTILAANTDMASAGSAVSTQASSIATAATDATGAVADAGVDLSTDGSFLYAAEQARQTVLLLAGDPTVPSGCYYEVQVVDDAVVSGAVTSFAQVDAACVEIEAHVTALLAADCRANLITVPILSRDAGGFYVPPSVSLIHALQAFLDARKDTAHTVSVVSGGAYLVRAVLQIRVGVLAGRSLSLLQTGAAAAADGVLRNRRFGQSLYQSDLVNAIQSIDGVAFVNVTIQGYLSETGSLLTDKLDPSGNLLVLSSDLVSKGQVTVTAEYQV